MNVRARVFAKFDIKCPHCDIGETYKPHFEEEGDLLLTQLRLSVATGQAPKLHLECCNCHKTFVVEGFDV